MDPIVEAAMINAEAMKALAMAIADRKSVV